MSVLVKNGDQFGRLVVVRKSKRKGKQGQSYVVCKCECGNEKEVFTGNLLQNRVRSCGCLMKENKKPLEIKYLESKKKHSITASELATGKTLARISEIEEKHRLKRELDSFYSYDFDEVG